MKACVICASRPRVGALMCKQCGLSYDRSAFRDGTIAEAITWAAKRARLFERRRHADAKEKP